MTDITPQNPPEKDRSIILRLLLAVIDIHAVSMILYLIARGLRVRFWFVELMGSFLPILLLMGIPFLLYAIWQKRKVSIGLASVSIAAFVILYGGHFLPQRTPQCDDCTGIRVMTYNVCVHKIPSEDLTDYFERSGADIIAIQELGYDHMAVIERDLLDVYPHQVLYGAVGVDGAGIISKYPIIDSAIIEPYDPDLLFPDAGISNGLQHLWAEIDVNGQHVLVIDSHPPMPTFMPDPMNFMNVDIRSHDIMRLLDMAEDSDMPVVLLGDFNAGEQSQDYAMIKNSGLRDAFAQAGTGLGLSFPTYGGFHEFKIPRIMRLDYVWFDEHFEVEKAWMGEHIGSDHVPLLADLLLK